MPRETIRSRGFQPDHERDLDHGGLIQVGWARDANVINLQSQLPDPVDVIESLLVNEVSLSFELSLDEIQEIAKGLAPLLDGWWVELDRPGSNALIATLRRARDAAFGKDV